MTNYAVFTGDLVASQKMPPTLRIEIIDWLKSLVADFRGLFPGAMVGDVDIFRGDGWQLCLKDVSLALRAAMFIRAGLKAHDSRKAVDTRVGIGIGPVNHLVESKISESDGLAFTRSGTSLDSLSDTKLQFAMSWAEGPKEVQILEQTLFPLLDLHIERWTHAESVAIYGDLMGWTQQKTADHRLAKKRNGDSPTRQAIADALRRTGWHSHIYPVLGKISDLLHEKHTTPHKQAQ